MELVSRGTKEVLPSFIIGGPRKTGTTALWSYLCRHPDVGMAAIKEPRFFTRQRGRQDGAEDPAPPSTGTFDRGWEWYRSLFEGTEQKAARGEASTVYFSAPDAAQMIASYVPWVRLIFILRHPIEQMHSHYWQERRHDTSLPSFERLVEEGHPRLSWYLYECQYSVHLARYRALFEGGQLLVLRSDELLEDVDRTVDRVCRFIGVDREALRGIEKRSENEAAATRWPWVDRLLNQHRGNWMRMVPKRAVPLIRESKWRIVRANERPLEYAPMPCETRERLKREVEDDVLALEAMTGWDLDHWRR